MWLRQGPGEGSFQGQFGRRMVLLESRESFYEVAVTLPADEPADAHDSETFIVIHCRGPGGAEKVRIKTIGDDSEGDGVHLGYKTYQFLDGHAGLFSFEPIRNYWFATNLKAYTYPPGVPAGQADWWTVPFYPDHYPYSQGQALPP